MTLTIIGGLFTAYLLGWAFGATILFFRQFVEKVS